MAKKKAKKPAKQPAPRSETHVRMNFTLDKRVLRGLRVHVFEQKLAAKPEGGGRQLTMSQFVEDAVRDELARRKKRGR